MKIPSEDEFPRDGSYTEAFWVNLRKIILAGLVSTVFSHNQGHSRRFDGARDKSARPPTAGGLLRCGIWPRRATCGPSPWLAPARGDAASIRQSRSSATRSIDNSLGGIFLHK